VSQKSTKRKRQTSIEEAKPSLVFMIEPADVKEEKEQDPWTLDSDSKIMLTDHERITNMCNEEKYKFMIAKRSKKKIVAK